MLLVTYTKLYSFFELILNSTIPWFEFPVSSFPPVFLRVASSSSSEKFDASEGVFESSSDPDAAEPSEDGDNESDISSAYTRCAYRSIWYILYQNISWQNKHMIDRPQIISDIYLDYCCIRHVCQFMSLSGMMKIYK